MSHRVRANLRARILCRLAAAGSIACLSPAFGASPSAPGQGPFNQPVCCTPRAALPGEASEAGLDAAPGLAARIIERSALAMLSPEHRARLFDAGLADAGAPSLPPEIAAMPPLGDEGYAVVRRLIRREAFDRMLPVHQRALVKLMEDQADGESRLMLCFGPGTDAEVVDAFNRAANGAFNERFRQGSRWTTTATNTSPTSQGDRVTLRYSFVPDGTSVPNLNADAASSGVTSNLFAFLNGLYGSPAVWQPIYQQIFTRWSTLIGVNYVFEPNDDGVPIAGGASGVVGVRGDLRLAGTTLDGPSNVLAFNYFPSSGVGGDMVIDTADTFYNNLGGNSLRLRNVLAHEHGHGLGMAHVCPINNTKLMEPTVSTAYDGPQFDDILNGQRHYGDPLEPNDSIAAAFNVGTLDATVRQIGQLLSVDDDADSDVFRFEVSGAGILTVTATPQGSTYLEGAQNANGSCSAGVAFDALRINTLSATGLGSAGETLQSVTASAPGQPASLALVCPSAGTYYVRIGGGPVNNIQAYRLTYSLTIVPGITVTATPPTVVSPDGPTSFAVQFQVVNDTIPAGAARLFYRSAGSAFQSVDLVPTPGGQPGAFTASLPPFACGSSPEFYVSATTATGLSASFPAAGAAAPRTAVVGESASAFSDDFESDTGWSYGVPGDTATTGLWIRDVPVGTGAQPGTTTSGTRCAVTGNAAAGAALGTNDVDTGFTTLLSPAFDLTGAVSARVSHQRWYTNNLGNAPNTKIFAIDISSDNGATWTRGETVGPSSPAAAWLAGGFDVPASVGFTASMRVRFIADDTGTGSLVEAAIDDFSVTAVRCVSVPPPCPADFDLSGTRDVSDIFAFLSAWFASGPGSDFDQSGTRDVSDIFAFLSAWFAGC